MKARVLADKRRISTAALYYDAAKGLFIMMKIVSN
jgi:hypothetical protein